MAYVCSFSGAVAGFSPSPERRIKGHECISLVANILHTLLSDLNYLPSVGEQIGGGGCHPSPQLLQQLSPVF